MLFSNQRLLKARRKSVNVNYTIGIISLIVMIGVSLGDAFSDEVPQEVYLLVRERELLAFSAVGDVWVTQDLISAEVILESKFEGRVIVVVTNLRVLGFSALTSRWVEKKLRVGESPITIEAKGNVGAVITNLRAFGFSAKRGGWTVKRLGLK
jgi:hypothetical protein